MNKELAKSPEVLQKEAEVAALEKALKKKKTTLKSLKTRLKNTRERITDMQRNGQVQMMNKMEDLDNLRIEIAELAAELKNAKGMSKQDKAELGEMAESMANEGFGEEFDEYKERMERMRSGDFDFDEEFAERIRDMFEPFRVQPDEKEKKNIRKVFLNLSKKFHPDKARDEAQAEEYHSVMQKINEAYQNNDIETLLEMERLYLHEEPDFDGVAMADILQQKIDYLNREIAFITNQTERTSSEIKNLRESDLGQMLTHADRAERHGVGMDAMIEQLDMSINIFTKLRDAFKESIEHGEISPKIHEVTMEMMELGMEDELGFMDDIDKMPGSLEEMMEQMSEIMGVDSDELMGMFDGGMAEVENPKFPIGSSVRIKQEYVNIFRGIDMHNWEGRVIEAFYGDDEDDIVYTVEFDSITMQQMPNDYVNRLVSTHNDFQEEDVPEEYLEAAKPRDTKQQAIATYRIRYHEFTWNHLNKKQAERMQKIMTQHPEKSDYENWQIYLNKELKFPVPVHTAGRLSNPRGLQAEIVEIGEVSVDYGLYVKIVSPDFEGPMDYPLLDLHGRQRSGKNRQALIDYQMWVEDFFGE